MTAPEIRPAAPVMADPGGPTTSAGRALLRLMPMLTVPNAAMYMVYMGIGVVLLPIQVELVDPADKVANLGLVSGISAIFATLFNPLAGLFSDRSGRRDPWILGGGLAAPACWLSSARPRPSCSSPSRGAASRRTPLPSPDPTSRRSPGCGS
ncbi:hypothetical protein [Streptomyces sp. NPDC059802]|uniref:hypothetical protein n=1 Tax=Streptomyces sp. NPDC059802 TaxID=3346952 RepID=UPI00366787C8